MSLGLRLYPMRGMNHDRMAVAQRAAGVVSAAGVLPPALVGFDGFIDSIIDMVDRRHDMSPQGYTRIATIPAFAARCAAAAGKSTNIERVIRERRFGGNGPLMAGALAGLGVPVTYIGAVGEESGSGVHPLFTGFAGMCRRVFPVGPPSTTECLEFDDGKLMLNETAAAQGVTWDRIVSVVGLQVLRRIVDEAALVGIVNWSLLGGVPGIWRGLLRDVLGSVSAGIRRVFIDLSDPAKRIDADIREAMGLLGDLDRAGLRVMLGLNLAESQRIAAVVGAGEVPSGASLEQLSGVAGRIRARMGVECVVIHPRHGAAAATDHETAWIDGPFTSRPRLSTGAGDHFNAGFALGRVARASLAESLAIGCAVSGAYVRDARSPDRARLAEFLREFPLPKGVGA